MIITLLLLLILLVLLGMSGALRWIVIFLCVLFVIGFFDEDFFDHPPGQSQHQEQRK